MGDSSSVSSSQQQQQQQQQEHDEEQHVDLDVFLAGVESKLRSPFSSLELSRVISTTTSPSSKQYLQTLVHVLPRMDTVVQLRVLIALLGLDLPQDDDDDNDTYTVVYNLLVQAQDETLFEEWVRVAAGLVQGILFSNDDDDDDSKRDVGKEATRVLIKTCGGQEARTLLEQEAKAKGKQQINDKQLNGILDHYQQQQQQQQSAQQDDDGAATSSLRKKEEDGIVDLHPLFAPYFYSLVNPQTLQRVLPECMSNPHFTVNESADILTQDEKREREEQSASASAATTTAVSAASSDVSTEQQAAPATKLPPVIMPGRKATAASSKVKSRVSASAPKSSMFLPSTKPSAVVAGRMGRQMAKPGLHTRKAGAAQKLMGKSRRLGQAASGSMTAKSGGGLGRTAGTTGSVAAAASSGGGGRAMKFGNARSKMKMIDVSEVENIAKERQERETKETQEQKMSAKKRKIMEAAAARGIVAGKGAKRNKPNESPATKTAQTAQPTDEQRPPFAAASTSHTTPSGVGRLEAAAANALLAYQQHQDSGEDGSNAPVQQDASTAPPAPSAAATAAVNRTTLAPGNKEELDALLGKSNKLSDENRVRVKQFWNDRFNPTPDMPVVRMKLHEEKILDPESGLTVKNTDYLELDYNTFSYKKLRKSKKK